MDNNSFSDQEVIDQLMDHLDYEYTVLGVRPWYANNYVKTSDEDKNQPKSPLLY